jgi:peptide/nickel transport system ATP-binding protein
MASIPRLDRKWEEAEVDLKANQPELTRGCVYYERCPVAFGKCREAPPLIEIEKDHFVACRKESDKNAKARQNI